MSFVFICTNTAKFFAESWGTFSRSKTHSSGLKRKTGDLHSCLGLLSLFLLLSSLLVLFYPDLQPDFFECILPSTFLCLIYLKSWIEVQHFLTWNEATEVKSSWIDLRWCICAVSQCKINDGWSKLLQCQRRRQGNRHYFAVLQFTTSPYYTHSRDVQFSSHISTVAASRYFCAHWLWMSIWSV